MSNMSTAMQRMEAQMDTSAYAIAAGTQAFADVHKGLFTLGLTDAEANADYCADYYGRMRRKAEGAAITRGKPLKDQSAKSEASQKSKMATAGKLAAQARDRDDDDVIRAYEALWRLAQAKYTPVVKGTVAMLDTLAKVPGADYDTLHAAIVAALTEKPELASEAVKAVLNTWDTLVHGDEKAKTPSPHQAAFASLLQAYPQDYAKHVADTLAAIVVVFEKAEKAAVKVEMPKIG